MSEIDFDVIGHLHDNLNEFNEIFVMDDIDYKHTTLDSRNVRAPNLHIYCHSRIAGPVRSIGIITFRDWHINIVFDQEIKTTARSRMVSQMIGYDEPQYKQLIELIGKLEDKFGINILDRVDLP